MRSEPATSGRFSLLGERRALALLLLGFYTSIFFVLGLAQGGAWMACFLAMSATYGLSFFALASEWFWARWFTMGLGTSGVTMAVLGLVTAGWNWALVVWGAMHGLIYLPLLGATMAARYENKAAWRERYNLDEAAVARVKRAVHGAATALPTMIFYTLAPRQDASLAGLLALGMLGFVGLVRMRFWGVVLLGVSGVWMAASVFFGAPVCSCWGQAMGGISPSVLSPVGLFAAAALFVSISPFMRPALRVLRGR